VIELLADRAISVGTFVVTPGIAGSKMREAAGSVNRDPLCSGTLLLDDLFDCLSQPITSLGADGRYMNRIDKEEHHGDIGFRDDSP
jgi:hypothetical protein